MMGVGLVGLGFGASAHLPAWRAERRARVLGLCGGDPERSRVRAAEWGYPHLSFQEMLNRSDIKALSLCVPPSLQSEMIRAGAAAGKHIFCEKPVGSNVAQAKAALLAAESAKIVHGVDLFFPKIPAWAQARRTLEELGTPRHAHLSWLLQTRAFREGGLDWKTRPDLGGGTLANFASHSFHYLEWLFGPIASLIGRQSGGHGPDVQGGAHLLLVFRSGMTASFDVAADAYPGSGHRLEFYGSQGGLTLSNNSGDFARGFQLHVSKNGEPATCLVGPTSGQGDGRCPMVAKMVTDFVDCVVEGKPMNPGLNEGLRVQELIEAAARSIAEGTEVKVA